MRLKPETTAYLSIKECCFLKKQVKGVVKASQFKWQFTWSFGKRSVICGTSIRKSVN